MKREQLEKLPKETLVKLIEMYGKNWLSVDGLWFQGVEEKYGHDAALEIDLKMWERNSIIEVRRIKEVLNITDSDVPAFLKILDCVSFSQAFTFEVEELTPTKAVFYYPHCVPQEARLRQGVGEFACRSMGLALQEHIARTVNPKARVECLFCPPDAHPADCWCKWQISIPA